MSNFLNIRTDDWTIWGLVGSAILTLVGFCMVMSENFGGGGGGPRDRAVKCANLAAGCEFAEEWSPEQTKENAKANLERITNEDPEKAEMLRKNFAANNMMMPGMMPGMMPSAGNEARSPEEMMEDMLLSGWGNPMTGAAFKCPKCSEESVYFSLKCKECDTIFHRDPSKKYPDQCPSCGVSRREEMEKKNREEKAKKREKNRKK